MNFNFIKLAYLALTGLIISKESVAQEECNFEFSTSIFGKQTTVQVFGQAYDSIADALNGKLSTTQEFRLISEDHGQPITVKVEKRRQSFFSDKEMIAESILFYKLQAYYLHLKDTHQASVDKKSSTVSTSLKPLAHDNNNGGNGSGRAY